MSQKIAGSDRYVTLQKRAEDLVISPKLDLYECDDLTPVDPITYEVIAHKLTQLTGELGATLQRVSGSVIVTEAHDFNVSLGDERGSLFNVGDYATTHGTASQNVIRWTLENRSENPGIEEGDMFLSNDPWIGSVHQPDTSLLVPIFVEGKLFCWATNTMHLLDTGGQYPGGLNTAAEDVFAESMPLPPIKLVRKGELQVDVEDMFLRRSRLPKLVALDLRAMIAANNVATTRIRELVEAYGAATLQGRGRYQEEACELHGAAGSDEGSLLVWGSPRWRGRGNGR